MRADLRKATLAGADLGGADLSGADLRGANLNGAVLTDAVMENTHFIGANLKGTLNDRPAGRNLLVSDLDEPLRVLIAKHERWVESQGREGAQIDLSGFDSAQRAAARRHRARGTQGERFRCSMGSNLAGIGFAAAQLERADLRSWTICAAPISVASASKARASPTATCATAGWGRCS